MAKTKSTSVPLQQRDHDELLRVVQESEEPIDAAKVARLATTSRRAKTDEAVAILDQFVSEGRLKSFPAKTEKGKPRYWDRDPIAIGRAAVLDRLQQSPEPVTAKQLRSQLKLPFKLSEPEIAAILEECAGEGRIHPIPAKTAKSGLRYWNHDAGEFARRCLLAHLHDKGPQTEVVLKRSVKWLDEGQIKRLLESLTEAHAMYRHPPVGTSKKVVFGDRPPSPEPYLKKIGEQLTAVVERLTAAEVSVVALRRALVQVVESAGVSLAPASAANGEIAPQPGPSVVDLVALMKQVEPGAERGALVTTRDLRRAAKLNKADFDARALELGLQGKLVLHRHDYASSLSPDEQDELVTDGKGNYYVGLALRAYRKT